MLSASEENLLRDNGYCMDHLAPYFALTLGEPFLLDDTLFYYDGRVLVMVGYTLDRMKDPSILSGRLRRAILTFAPNPLVVNYYGPAQMSLQDIVGVGYRSFVNRDPIPKNIDMQVDLGRFEWSRSARLRKDITYASKRDYKVIVEPLWNLSAAHLTLIDNFFARRHDTEPTDREYAVSLAAFVRDPTTLAINAYHHGELAGFAIVSLWMKRSLVYVSAFYEKRFLGVSDVVMKELLELSTRNDRKIVDLGYSIHDGNFNYKRKWGANLLMDPFYEQIVSSGDAAQNGGYWFWKGRLIAAPRLPAGV